jgi:hypothetical protein
LTRDAEKVEVRFGGNLGGDHGQELFGEREQMHAEIVKHVD